MKNNGTYIITEGALDAELIKKILPGEVLDKVKVIFSGGFSSVLSKARSMLIQKPNSQIFIILDADTTNEFEVQEKNEFIEDYMKIVARGNRFKLFLQVPEIESVFFEKKDLIERIIGKKLTDLEFEFAKEKPKKNLEVLLGGKSQLKEVMDKKLTKSILDEIREFDFPKQLIGHLKDAGELQRLQ